MLEILLINKNPISNPPTTIAIKIRPGGVKIGSIKPGNIVFKMINIKIGSTGRINAV